MTNNLPELGLSGHTPIDDVPHRAKCFPVAFLQPALAVALLLGACSTEAPASQSGIRYGALQQQYPGDVDHAVSAPKVEVRAAMQNNAGIKIIHVPVEGRDDAELGNSFRGFANGDPDVQKLLASQIAAATHGRYVPKTVSNTRVPAISLGKKACMDFGKKADHFQVQEAASAAQVPGEINLIALGAPACDGKTAGEAQSSDAMPILADNTIGATMPTIAIHEMGHLAGANHAGETICNGVVPNSCLSLAENTRYATADGHSIMSYAGTESSRLRFTALDMLELGLLKPSEVTNVTKPGVFTVSPFGVSGPKLLQLPDGVYVSVEKVGSSGGDRFVTQARVMQTMPNSLEEFPMRINQPGMSDEENQLGGRTKAGAVIVDLKDHRVLLARTASDGTTTIIVARAA